MLTEKFKELEEAKAKVEELEKKIAAARLAELGALPEKYGFTSFSAFVKAVKAAMSSAPAKKAAPGKLPKAKAEKARRHRAVITAETRNQVKQLVEAGKTGTEIADALSISLPSVQNIKKAMGLVKTRAVEPVAPVEAPAPAAPQA